MKLALVLAIGSLSVTASALSACSVNASVNSAPSVSKDALQKDISDKLTAAGAAPQSVTCRTDLVGEVGKTTICDVALSDTNAVEANVRVTAAHGTTVDYDTTPSISQQQLEKSVTATLMQSGEPKMDAISCESGLDGKVGASAYCKVSSAGASARRLATVDKVDGLSMNYTIAPHLAKTDVETSLLDQLQQQLGQRPDSATCADDLQGAPNATLDCDVVAGSQAQTFTLVVTTVDGSKINYSFAPKGE